MKKNALLSGLLTALVFISFSGFATVWRVNSAPGSAAHYTSIQAAHDATTTLSGDTLYIEGAGTSQGTLSATKKLVIIGTGYFLAENPQTQASPVASYLDYVYFYQGSEGSKIMGITTQYIYLYASNIFINRCRMNGGATYAIYAPGSSVSNIVITQNYIASNVYYNYGIYFPSASNNILITNNYIYGQIYSGSSFSSIIENNVVDGYINVYNSTLKNNILKSYGYFTNNNCTFSYNMSYNTDFGTSNGNQSSINMSTVFVGSTGYSTDGQFQLKPGSPAIGAGENGVDCGMYGGVFPYRLSGMPNIPSIYYFNAPSIPSNTINVAIKAKSHN